MAYLRNKEVTKFLNFTNVVSQEDIPKYSRDYVFDDEYILASYQTSRDYGIFTDSKVVLFDNSYTFGTAKQVFVVPYEKFTGVAIIFKFSGAELNCLLDGGNQLRLKFLRMSNIDKLRLRLLYSHIIRMVNKQKPDNNIMQQLINNDIKFKEN